MKSRLFRSYAVFAAVTLLSCVALMALLLGWRAGWDTLLDVLPVWVLAALGLMLLSVLVAQWLVRDIVRPFRDMARTDGELSPRYDEINALVSRLRRQNQLIRQQTNDLRQQQEEFRALTEHMAEGFLLVGNQRDILSYNASALRLLDAPEAAAGDNAMALSRSEPFQAALEQALAGQHAERMLHQGGRDCQLLANPVWTDGQISGAVIVIMDVTEKEQRDALRREFASNVSHELKTPLTTIYGASELLMHGMVKAEDVAQFSGSIHREAGRLIALVEDIMRISRLDDAAAPLEREPLDLWRIVQDAAAELQDAARRRQVTLRLSGQPLVICGIPTVLYEMAFNLIDNAIKYNRPDGRVDISVTAEDGCPVLRVADTGIGIPPEHQARVFERFYRVDKSHSRQIGGTGLGLSIVKHGAAHHGAEVQLESKVGEGTVVTIQFPCQTSKGEGRT